ncbi:aquaporin Z [Citricoccus sp. GCM10030269]|uniref:aquaporin Z n=1 Tax=Citricoccus sp. GCM10030269 TaxID=3273388 RepID=UPI003618727A
MTTHSTLARWLAEFLGTFVLVFGGCGTAVFAAQVMDTEAGTNMGVGFLGVAFAFGLTVLVMAYAVGHISGGHFNPAVTLGTALAGRTKWSDVGPYMVIQILGATVAGALLLAIAVGKEGFSAVESGFATNGYGERSPDGYTLVSVLLIEIILTAVFLYVILGATDRRAPAGLGPLAIGLSLTLIHLISIPVSNTSVNPARSLGVAWFAGGEALGQVWLFIVAPLIGAAIAGLTYNLMFPDRERVNVNIAGEEANDATA